jgi:hypothetical protein
MRADTAAPARDDVRDGYLGALLASDVAGARSVLDAYADDAEAAVRAVRERFPASP